MTAQAVMLLIDATKFAAAVINEYAAAVINEYAGAEAGATMFGE